MKTRFLEPGDLTLLGEGFEDKYLGSSPGLLGQKVARVGAHQPGELTKSSPSKPSE